MADEEGPVVSESERNGDDHQRWVALMDEELPAAGVDKFLRDRNAGAVTVFLGTTREFTSGVQTESLSYESYQSMALTEMHRLIDEAIGKWRIEKVCVLHRLGVVDVEEASVIIGVSTAHRSDAFDACRFLIDALKESVPIWKKETFISGESIWVNDPLPDTTLG